MAKQQRGRPPIPKAERRPHRVTIYMRTQEHAELVRRADADGVTLSTQAWLILERALRGKRKEK